MSLSMADASYLNTVSQWITDHTWVGSVTVDQQSILVVQVDDTTQPEQYYIQSGFGDVEISASYTPGVDQLDNLLVSLNVPEFGLVTLVDEPTYTLSYDQGPELGFSVAGLITGDFAFRYVGDNQEVVTDYALDVPYADAVEGSISVFPVDIRRATIDSASPSGAKRSVENAWYTDLKVRDTDKNQLVADFLNDHTVKNGILVAQEGRLDYTVDVSFLGLQLTGVVDLNTRGIGASLYARFPFTDRVKLGDFQAHLSEGIMIKIDVTVAQGTVKLFVDGDDVYTTLNFDVQNRKVNAHKLRLFSLRPPPR